MNLTQPHAALHRDASFSQITDQLAHAGHITLLNAWPDAVMQPLFDAVLALNPTEFKAAQVGRQATRRRNPFVRQDRIRWISRNDEFARAYLDCMEQLRLHLNRHLQLGLFDFECLMAHYPQGAFYRRHLDAFKGQSLRRLSVVTYLNPGWASSDGGELLMYQKNRKEPFTRVLPLYGTTVIFLSERFPHEVLPAGKSRHSITGWFRINDPTCPLLSRLP